MTHIGANVIGSHSAISYLKNYFRRDLLDSAFVVIYLQAIDGERFYW